MKSNRLNHMENYISLKDFVSLDELCEAFDKSKNTIRRDVNELAAAGIVQKVYGGVKPTVKSCNTLVNFMDRNFKNNMEKKRIGELAAGYINNGDVIFIDSGTTTVNIIENLSRLNGITVLTNNLYGIVQCMNFPGVKVISLGGQLNCATASFSSSFYTLENLKQFNINKAFMAATGVSIDKGVTHTSTEELEIKRSVVEISDVCFLLADSTKMNKKSLLTYAQLTEFQYVVTDAEPPEPYKRHFMEHNIKLVTK